MKKFSGIVILTAAIFIVLLFSACPAEVPKTVTISDVRWNLYNYDASYVSDTNIATAFIKLIILTEENLASSDISSIEITTANGTGWEFNTPAEIASLATVVASIFITDNLFLLTYDLNGHAIPLGIYNVEITLVGGNSDSSAVDVLKPGTIVTGVGAVGSTETTPMPNPYERLQNRAGNISASNIAGAAPLTVSFNVSDTRIYDGKILFYDGAGIEIGESEMFLSNGAPKAFVNSGVAFYNDSTQNEIIITLGETNLSLSGKNIPDVASVRVLLTTNPSYHEPTDVSVSVDEPVSIL